MNSSFKFVLSNSIFKVEVVEVVMMEEIWVKCCLVLQIFFSTLLSRWMSKDAMLLTLSSRILTFMNNLVYC